MSGTQRARERVRKISRATQRKYLITWSLRLGSEELAKISSQPAALDKALHYVQGLVKESGLEIYRIVSMEELTRFVPLTMSGTSASAHPSGIVIVKADSVEEARKMIEEWVDGLRYGMISIGEYLEYEIKPLVEIGRGGRE